MVWIIGTTGTLLFLGVCVSVAAFVAAFLRDSYRAVRWSRRGLCPRCHAPVSVGTLSNGHELVTCPNGHGSVWADRRTA